MKETQECSRESWRFACRWILLSGWHGLHWSFSMMHPVTFGGCLGFFSHCYNNDSFCFQRGDLTVMANWYRAMSKAEHMTAFSHRGWVISWTNQLSVSLYSKYLDNQLRRHGSFRLLFWSVLSSHLLKLTWCFGFVVRQYMPVSARVW